MLKFEPISDFRRHIGVTKIEKLWKQLIANPVII